MLQQNNDVQYDKEKYNFLMMELICNSYWSLSTKMITSTFLILFQQLKTVKNILSIPHIHQEAKHSWYIISQIL